MERRDFLRRTTLALAGGLVLGDAALEAYERLTHRKVFALGGHRTEFARVADAMKEMYASQGGWYWTRDFYLALPRVSDNDYIFLANDNLH